MKNKGRRMYANRLIFPSRWSDEDMRETPAQQTEMGGIKTDLGPGNGREVGYHPA